MDHVIQICPIIEIEAQFTVNNDKSFGQKALRHILWNGAN